MQGSLSCSRRACCPAGHSRIQGENGEGGGAGAGGSAGGDGGGEHAPTPLHSTPYRLSNAALPDQAQRMRSLFASDNPYVPCGVGREAWEEGDMRAGRREGV